MSEHHIKDFTGRHIHMMGIGGISMSGLAHYLLTHGYKVSGCDVKATHLTKNLEKVGVEVFIEHDPSHLSDVDMLVYTAAVRAHVPEFQAALKLKIPMMDRATLLGQIMQNYPHAITVSGTHGKTTTTSMIACIFETAGVDPTLHIGGELDLIGGGTKTGEGPYLIAEADEYMKSFHQFYPQTAVVLNIEFDHPDAFADIEDVYQAFLTYAKRLPKDGLLVGFGDDPQVSRLLQECDRPTVSFGLSPLCDVKAENIAFDELGCATFDVSVKGTFVGSFTLCVPGKHNVTNALSAIAVATHYGLTPAQIQKGFSAFGGTRRRFEKMGIMNGVEIYHDYAHHPTEVRMMLSAASLRHPRKIWCIFQPHTFTRTKQLFNDFAASFEDADEVILTDIYSAARETDDGTIHSRDLATAIQNNGTKCRYAASFDEAAAIVKQEAQSGDIVILTGAGSIDQMAKALL